jgi:hypothetical protein
MHEDLAGTGRSEVLQRRLDRLGIAVCAFDARRAKQAADDLRLRLARHDGQDNRLVWVHIGRLAKPHTIPELGLDAQLQEHLRQLAVDEHVHDGARDDIVRAGLVTRKLILERHWARVDEPDPLRPAVHPPVIALN